MATQNRPSQRNPDRTEEADVNKSPDAGPMADWKPGSEPEKARDVASRGDFGAAESDLTAREYTSENTRRSEPGAAHPSDFEHQGKRDHGVGVPDTGPGSGSGGDVDTDIIGLGTGGGVSISGPGDAPGADDVTGTENPFATQTPAGRQGDAFIEPARGDNQTGVHHVGGTKQIKGTVVQEPDAQSTSMGEGSDAAGRPVPYDDAAAGEISSGEARGEDLPMQP